MMLSQSGGPLAELAHFRLATTIFDLYCCRRPWQGKSTSLLRTLEGGRTLSIGSKDFVYNQRDVRLRDLQEIDEVLLKHRGERVG